MSVSEEIIHAVINAGQDSCCIFEGQLPRIRNVMYGFFIKLKKKIHMANK